MFAQSKVGKPAQLPGDDPSFFLSFSQYKSRQSMLMEGSHCQGSSAAMTISQDQPGPMQQYVNSNLRGKSGGDADVYRGYRNIDVLINGMSYGLLGGQVWYHTWHGAYLQTATL